VLTDLRNRGVRAVFFVVCDGLKGLPEVVGHVRRWRSCRRELFI
jgi:putative transposase